MGRSADEPFYITYFLGDLAQISMLFIGVGLGILWSRSFRLEALSVYLLAAALIAPVSANKLWGLQYHWMGRFDPPHVLLISASAAGIMCASRGKDRLIWLIAALGMTLLAALSGMRTILFLALLSLVFVSALALLDVANQVSEDCLVGNVARCIFGRGHGATYEAEISHPGPNITPEGRVHNVHFGPALLVLRYGFPGLLGYIFTLILGLYNLYLFFRRCSATCVRRYTDRERRELFVFGTIALALILSIINFTMRTILVDPLTGLILGLNMGYLLQTRRLFASRLSAYNLGRRFSNA